MPSNEVNGAGVEPDRADLAREMGERIAQARREAGYRTAKEFAEALDISVWTVRSWEAGKSQPRYDMLYTISRLTGRPQAWFLGEQILQDRLNMTIGELLERWTHPREDEVSEAEGVYGIAAADRAAEAELQKLSANARKWGVLLKITAPVPPVTADLIAALHLALAGIAGGTQQ